MNEALKKCPWCGLVPEPETKTIHGDYYFIHRCKVIGPITIQSYSKGINHGIWNTRTDLKTNGAGE